MIPGIDPKVDIAFKRVFGSPQWEHLTRDLIEAVLSPAPWKQLVELEFLNPYTEPMNIDDKLSILDIKARDDQGRLYNLEMQIVANDSLSQRFLYYWSLLYSSQLRRGDDYGLLRPTISICFVNGRMFSNSETYHQQFRLRNATNNHVLTDDLDIHILELTNFQRRLEELNCPLDFWLYWLKNAVRLDADELPGKLDTLELRQAMEVLKMFSQDEMANELYQGRLKAERDAKMHYLDSQRAQARVAALHEELAEMERQFSEAAQRCSQIEQQRVDTATRLSQAEQQLFQAEQQRSQAEQQRSEAEREIGRELARRIQLCERLLARSVTAESQLLERQVSELRKFAESLEAEVSRRV